jgi:hypothetical protein
MHRGVDGGRGKKDGVERCVTDIGKVRGPRLKAELEE